MKEQEGFKSEILPKKIQIYPFLDNLHSADQTLLSHPPEGYKFIGITKSKKQSLMNLAKSSKLLKFFYHQFVKLAKTTALIEFLYSSKKIPWADLIFSINAVYMENSPWVLEILDSTPHGLTGYNYSLFLKKLDKINAELLNKNCKKIICTNPSSLRLMKKFFSNELHKKLVLIERPVIFDKFGKKIGHKETTILFMGSLTNPQDFYVKGGLETLGVFEQINKKYPCKLILKCHVPEKLRSRVLTNKNIALVEDRLSQEQISDLYLSSDIFLSPSHTMMGSIIEAMAHGLPVVCLNTFSIEDYVKNNQTGIIVKKSDKIKEYEEESYPTNLRTEEFAKRLENVDKEVIERLCDAVESLIKSPALRKKIGENGKKIAIGKFNIEKRNKLLKKVFDEILQQ